MIQRYYGYFFVTHDQELLGNRFTANLNHKSEAAKIAVWVLKYRWTFPERGFGRRIPLAPSDSVDPPPIPGSYG